MLWAVFIILTVIISYNARGTGMPLVVTLFVAAVPTVLAAFILGGVNAHDEVVDTWKIRQVHVDSQGVSYQAQTSAGWQGYNDSGHDAYFVDSDRYKVTKTCSVDRLPSLASWPVRNMLSTKRGCEDGVAKWTYYIPKDKQ